MHRQPDSDGRAHRLICPSFQSHQGVYAVQSSDKDAPVGHESGLVRGERRHDDGALPGFASKLSFCWQYNLYLAGTCVCGYSLVPRYMPPGSSPAFLFGRRFGLAVATVVPAAATWPVK